MAKLTGVLTGYEVVKFQNGGTAINATIDGCVVDVKGSIGEPGKPVTVEVISVRGRLTAMGGVGLSFDAALASPRLVTPRAAAGTTLANG